MQLRPQAPRMQSVGEARGVPPPGQRHAHTCVCPCLLATDDTVERAEVTYIIAHGSNFEPEGSEQSGPYFNLCHFS